MDTQRSYSLGQEFAEALHAVDRHEAGAIEQMVARFSPEARLTNAALKQAHEERVGTDGVRAFWEAYQATFKEAQTEFFELTSSESAAGLFWTTRATNGRGEQLSYDGATLLCFGEDGKIALMRGYFDTRELSLTVGGGSD